MNTLLHAIGIRDTDAQELIKQSVQEQNLSLMKVSHKDRFTAVVKDITDLGECYQAYAGAGVDAEMIEVFDEDLLTPTCFLDMLGDFAYNCGHLNVKLKHPLWESELFAIYQPSNIM